MKKNDLRKTLEELGVLEKVENLGIDAPRDMLMKSVADLTRLLNIPADAANDILMAASLEAFDWRLRERTGNELIQQQHTRVLTTGDATMDKVFNGGISLGAITEVVGESSSGKTQLALQLCVAAQKPEQEGGLGGSAVYICTEGPFPSKRLDQLLHQYPEPQQEELRNNLFTIRVKNCDEQYRTIFYRLPAFVESQIKKKRVRVIVIDSIGALYRSEAHGIGKKRFERMSEICDLGTQLKKIADQYELAIIAVNQVADVPTTRNQPDIEQLQQWADFQLLNAEKSNSMAGLYIDSLLKKPILGVSWANSVNARIRMARSPILEHMKTRRILFLEFSPTAPRYGCELKIDNNGIHAI
ncbi:Rad51-domain-containing protein [Mycotypha africana]|uniref:Rad51-domain-containing protein n=1 Tax=Mycotypha africana TaxID=64632 RepID=UPI0023014E1A|nr:Rad51-domain-containing protein [Mycotypha africana]KAI8990854.1 Rad51-domain-containing protein [Mycotypha africana]